MLSSPHPLIPRTATLSRVPIQIVYETHSLTEDNARGIATGWLPGRLSERGRELAGELGQRRRDDGIAAVFSSDLGRAAETTSIAFDGSPVPVLLDWRLRECDYGNGNGTPTAELLARRGDHLDEPYPAGENWRRAVARVGRFLDDLPMRWSGKRGNNQVAHVATAGSIKGMTTAGRDRYVGEAKDSSAQLSALEEALRQALASAPRDQVLKCIVTALPVEILLDDSAWLHGGKARKVSVSMPQELAEAVRARTGEGGFSRYVTKAVDREIKRDSLGDLLDELEAEYGPVPEEVREQTRRMWPNFGEDNGG